MTTHEFAFHTSLVTQKVKNGSQASLQEITDPELVHRIVTVLRLEKGEKIILFDRLYHLKALIVAVRPKKSVTVEITALEKNTLLLPEITWGLPILKREAFDEALYSLCELGVTTIQPLITQKTSRSWSDEKETMRAQKILVAAAEQSKQFVLPILFPILSLEVWLLRLSLENQLGIFFDPDGLPVQESLARMSQVNPKGLVALNGPEADLTPYEKELVKQKGFIFCKLTPTILRAQEAVTVGLGIVRALL